MTSSMLGLGIAGKKKPTAAVSAALDSSSDHQIRTYSQQLVEIFKKHNPDKLSDVDSLLQKHAGREEELIVAVKKKYKIPL
jgi:hypothetical protein